jgi:hypothetical protein
MLPLRAAVQGLPQRRPVYPPRPIQRWPLPSNGCRPQASPVPLVPSPHAPLLFRLPRALRSGQMLATTSPNTGESFA